MDGTKMVICNDCGQEIPAGDSYQRGDRVLCEDCYFKSTQKVEACDPFAARSAELFREKSGIKDEEGLTALQKNILDFIRAGDKITIERLLDKFSVSRQDMENQLAVLRHCNLVKGQKAADKVYYVPF
jgi:DNA-directed RNA polymerase subunit RPC12/RpoP